jgi:hypothetical protein
MSAQVRAHFRVLEDPLSVEPRHTFVIETTRNGQMISPALVPTRTAEACPPRPQTVVPTVEALRPVVGTTLQAEGMQ